MTDNTVHWHNKGLPLTYLLLGNCKEKTERGRDKLNVKFVNENVKSRKVKPMITEHQASITDITANELRLSDLVPHYVALILALGRTLHNRSLGEGAKMRAWESATVEFI